MAELWEGELVYTKERKLLMAFLWSKEGGGDNIRREVKRDMLLFSLACSDGMISEFRHRVAGQVLLLVQKVEYITPCMLEVMGVKTTDWDRELK